MLTEDIFDIRFCSRLFIMSEVTVAAVCTLHIIYVGHTAQTRILSVRCNCVAQTAGGMKIPFQTTPPAVVHTAANVLCV